ncbi:hypothetical protein E3N88_00739 [Mikania micrantha]|uniref:Uncharacterized protein n=1 Tax=Mikania micrantha TaxID=192012 RepID=A0A5N6PZQ8_9ASTR|nr:hypothetical protein E3N88_00739 [Mikania micrantha]
MLSIHPTTTNLPNPKMKKGSNRFLDATRQSDGGSIVNSHKPSKKLKTLSSVDGMDKSTCSKRVKLPKKKRYSTNVISRCEISSTDDNNKLKLDPDEHHHLITKVEEEAIAGLLALSGIDNTHEINLNYKIPEATASKPEDSAKKCVQIDDLNDSRNIVDVKKDSKDVTDGNNNTRKRCSSHVYICRIIKNLQTTKGKTVNSHKESQTKTTPENATTFNRSINLNEPITVGKAIFQEQPSGCRVQPYFGNPFCDPSQWSRPLFPKQQIRMNPLMYNPEAQSGSYEQASLHNVLASKHKQQLSLKMQLDHHRSSGYDENGVLFCVDNPPTLELALR